jgi:hypothetical protein
VTTDLGLAVTVLGALLLVGAGASKVRRPQGAVTAMRAVGLPSTPGAVRLGAACECALGFAVLATASWVPRALLAASYLAFCAFAVASMRTGASAPCGCFGDAGAPLGTRHVVLDLIVATAAGATAASSASVPAAVAHAPVTGALVLALGVVSAMLAATVLRRAAVA